MISEIGDLGVLRLIQRGNETTILVRLASNYPSRKENMVVKLYELIIRKGGGKPARIVDLLAAGDDHLHSTANHVAAVALLFMNPDPLDRPVGAHPAIRRHSPSIGAVTRSMMVQDFSTGLRAARQIPPPLATDRSILLLKSSIAKFLSLPRYEEAVLEFARHYPGDAESDFLLLDLYTKKPNDSEMFKVVDRLVAVYEDPYLNYFKVDGLLRQNRMKEALIAIVAARNAAEHRSEIWVAGVAAMMQKKNHAETARAIEATEARFGDRVLDLSEFPDFQEFANSAEGRSCLGRRLGFET